MKLITAIIRPHKLDDVKEEMKDRGISGMTVTEVQGFGRQNGHASIYRGAEYVVDLLPKVKLEIIVDSTQSESVIEGILKQCANDTVGDGKIFVQALEQVIRIRTSETGTSAI